jgi:hypothetical protein
MSAREQLDAASCSSAKCAPYSKHIRSLTPEAERLEYRLPRAPPLTVPHSPFADEIPRRYSMTEAMSSA